MYVNSHSNYTLLQTITLFPIKLACVYQFSIYTCKLLRKISLDRNIIKTCNLILTIAHTIFRRVYLLLQNVLVFKAKQVLYQCFVESID